MTCQAGVEISRFYLHVSISLIVSKEKKNIKCSELVLSMTVHNQLMKNFEQFY